MVLFQSILIVLATYFINCEELKITIKPDYIKVKDVDERISISCTINKMNETSLISLDSNLTVIFNFNSNSSTEWQGSPDECDRNSYCSSTFQPTTFNQIKSLFSIPDYQDSFSVSCSWKTQDYELIGSSYGNVQLIKGAAFGRGCSLEEKCNSYANLTCNHGGICECIENHIAIPIYGSFDHNCAPFASHGESCVNDLQCQAHDHYSHCEERCECITNYQYDFQELKCANDFSNQDYDHDMHHNYYSKQWHLFIILLSTITSGMILVIIIWTIIIIYLRSKALQNSQMVNAKYPPILTPKHLYHRYFGKNKK